MANANFCRDLSNLQDQPYSAFYDSISLGNSWQTSATWLLRKPILKPFERCPAFQGQLGKAKGLIGKQVNSVPKEAVRSVCDGELQAGHMLRKVFNSILENDICDLTMRQMAIYINVSTQDSMTMTELANILNISMSSISRSVDALENKGVVRRDRKGKYVHVYATPRGRAVIGRAIAAIAH